MRSQEPPGSLHLPTLRATMWESCPRQLQYSLSCPRSCLPGMAFSRARHLPLPAPAAGSEPTSQHCPSISYYFLAGPVGHTSPDKTEAASQVGGQGVAESSGPWMQPTSVLMVGLQALSPACEQEAGASSQEVPLKS